MLILGCDPGLKGAYAVVDFNRQGKGDIKCLEHLPTIHVKKKNYIDFNGLYKKFFFWADLHPKLILEQAIIMPHQGSVSGFTIGYNFGLTEAAALAAGMEVHKVHPATWKKAVFTDLPVNGKKALEKADLKALSVKLAYRLFPDAPLIPPRGRVPSPDMAEALLMAYYGFTKNI